MNRSEEDKAFRRLKRIEWKLAYIENEQRWIEKRIKWTNNPKVVVLTSALFSVMLYLYFVGFSYLNSGAYYPDTLCLTALVIGFLVLSVAQWASREETDMRLTSAKRRMEQEAGELEKEREEIYRQYPQLRERPISSTSRLWFRRYVLPLLGILAVFVVFLFLPPPSSYDRAIIGAVTYLDYFFMILILPRFLGWGYEAQLWRRKRAKIPVEKEERFDILQYKRF